MNSCFLIITKQSGIYGLSKIIAAHSTLQLRNRNMKSTNVSIPPDFRAFLQNLDIFLWTNQRVIKAMGREHFATLQHNGMIFTLLQLIPQNIPLIADIATLIHITICFTIVLFVDTTTKINLSILRVRIRFTNLILGCVFTGFKKFANSIQGTKPLGMSICAPLIDRNGTYSSKTDI